MSPRPESDTPDVSPFGSAQPGVSGGAAAGPGRVNGHVLTRTRAQYIVAPRRTPGLAPFGVHPLTLNAVEQALGSSPDVEIVDRLGPTGTVAAMADGLAGPPNAIVARMPVEKAELLRQQGQGQLIVEEDQPLTLHGSAVMAPPMPVGTMASAPSLRVDVVVLGNNNAPVPNAEVYIYGTLLPAVGITNGQGQVTLSLMGDTPQTVRAIYVKPKADYWSFYQTRPLLESDQPNVVLLTPIAATLANFPGQQVVGWGQRAMRMDQIPRDYRGQGVRIAIVDSGAATTHDDLRGITRGIDILQKATNPQAWTDDVIAHGSHCAGVIAGSVENQTGIAGFAPAAEIHACKIFPGGQVSQLIDSLEYCIEKQIDLVNLSLGTDVPSEVLEQQLLRAKSLGIACIVSAGNTGGPVQYPASSPHALAVAAVGKIGEFPAGSYHAQTVQNVAPDGYFSPKFTCFGPEIGVCAPGVAVLSSVPPNNYAVWDGTSMAAPHITGLAALVLAHHPDFQGPFKARNAARVDRLFQILKASARWMNLGDPRRTGFGMPDALVALGLQQPALAPPPGITIGATPSFMGHATPAPGGGAVGHLWGSVPAMAGGYSTPSGFAPQGAMAPMFAFAPSSMVLGPSMMAPPAFGPVFAPPLPNFRW